MRTTRRNAIRLLGRLARLSVFAAAFPSQAFQMPVVQLTDDDGIDRDAQIVGSRIAWVSGDDIELLDGGTTTTLTEVGGTVVAFLLSETHLAWVSCPSLDLYGTCLIDPFRLHLYDGESTQALTDDDSSVTSFDLDGGRVVWSADGRVFSHEDGITTPVTEPPGVGEPDAEFPVVDGARVAWLRGDTILLHHGAETEPIWTGVSAPDASSVAADLRISADRVVWRHAPDGEDAEVWFYDGAAVVNASDNSVDDFSPSVSGTQIAWWNSGDGDGEIWLHDGTHTVAITDNDYDDLWPVVDGSQIFWTSRPEGPLADSEAFFFDGMDSRRLTWDDHDQILTHASVSDGRAVWTSCPGSPWQRCQLPIKPYSPALELEVFLAPEPGSMLCKGAALAVVAGLRARRRRASRAPAG